MQAEGERGSQCKPLPPSSRAGAKEEDIKDTNVCLPLPLSFRLPLAFPSGLPRSEGGFKKANEEVETARGGVKEGMGGTKSE